MHVYWCHGVLLQVHSSSSSSSSSGTARMGEKNAVIFLKYSHNNPVALLRSLWRRLSSYSAVKLQPYSSKCFSRSFQRACSTWFYLCPYWNIPPSSMSWDRFCWYAEWAVCAACCEEKKNKKKTTLAPLRKICRWPQWEATSFLLVLFSPLLRTRVWVGERRSGVR